MVLILVAVVLFALPMMDLLLPLGRGLLLREVPLSRRLQQQNLLCTSAVDMSAAVANVQQQSCPSIATGGCCVAYYVNPMRGRDLTCADTNVSGTSILSFNSTTLYSTVRTCTCYQYCGCDLSYQTYYPAGSSQCSSSYSSTGSGVGYSYSSGSASTAGSAASPNIGGTVAGIVIPLLLELFVAGLVWFTIKDVQPLHGPWPDVNAVEMKSKDTFSSGLCACCAGGCLDCCIGFYFPFALAARTAHQAAIMQYFSAVVLLHLGYVVAAIFGMNHLFMVFMFTTWRMTIRQKALLHEKGCFHDCCTVCWCTCCALIQEAHQVKRALDLRGDPKIGNQLVGQAIGVTPVQPFEVQGQPVQPGGAKQAW